jgi:hypothetical protein
MTFFGYLRNSLSSFLQCLFFAVLLMAVPSVSQAAASTPVIFYSDLDSGPKTGGENDNGVYVTIWGKNFGATRGTNYVTVGDGQIDNYPLWSDTKITFQLGSSAATGNIVVAGSNGASNGIPFTVRSGRIFFVTPTGTGNGSVRKPMSPYDITNKIRPGDTYYFRAGMYSGTFSGTSWQVNNFSFGQWQRGTAANPVALVGYPNEVATLVAPAGRGNIGFSTGDAAAGMVGGYTTIANLTLIGGEGCISGGGFYTHPKSGAPGVRVIGNVLSATYTGNTMSGLIVFQADHWRIWGNEIKDTGTTPPINNNHAIYVTVASSDVDIGWNYLHNLRMGHVIQVHTDSVPDGASCYTFTDVRIHDNVITATNVDDSRGINVGHTCQNSYGAIYNNILYNLGQRFSAIAMYTGSWKVYNNTLYNIHSDPMVWVAETGVAEVTNNIFYSDGNSGYVGPAGGVSWSQMTLSNNLYYGYRGQGAPAPKGKDSIMADPMFQDPQAGDFHLQPKSAAIDHGSDAVAPIVRRDPDGVPRPQGRYFDIGAYEAITSQNLAR